MYLPLPNLGLQADPDKKASSEKKFKEVADAYEVLMDPDKKARFDNGEDLNEPPQQVRAPPACRRRSARTARSARRACARTSTTRSAATTASPTATAARPAARTSVSSRGRAPATRRPAPPPSPRTSAMRVAAQRAARTRAAKTGASTAPATRRRSATRFCARSSATSASFSARTAAHSASAIRPRPRGCVSRCRTAHRWASTATRPCATRRASRVWTARTSATAPARRYRHDHQLQ